MSKIVFSINCARQVDIHIQKNDPTSQYEVELEPYLITYTKINAKYIIKLNELAKTVKVLGENMGVNPLDLGIGNGFLDMTPDS